MFNVPILIPSPENQKKKDRRWEWLPPAQECLSECPADTRGCPVGAIRVSLVMLSDPARRKCGRYTAISRVPLFAAR